LQKKISDDILVYGTTIKQHDATLRQYDKQDQQGKAAFNERNPHMTQQQEPVARSPGGPQTKTGQGTRQHGQVNH
jgi:hypothetical protein